MPTVKIRGDNKEAIKRLDEIIRKFDNTEQAARKSSKAAHGGFMSVQDALKKYSLGLTDIVSGLAVYDIAVNSLRKGIGFMKSFVSESAKQQEANLKLKFSIMAVGETLDRVYPKMTQKITDMQNATGVGDESLAGAFSLLNDYVKDSSKSIELLLPIIGMATFRNKSLEGTINAVGKAVSLGMTDSLREYGIQIDKTAFQTDRFGTMLKALEKYKDILPMRLDTYAGRMEKIASDMSDIKQAFAMPALEEVLKGLKISDGNMQSMKDAAAELGEALRGPVREGIAWLMAGMDELKAGEGSALFKSLSDSVYRFFDMIGSPTLWNYVGDTAKAALENTIGPYVSSLFDPESMGLRATLVKTGIKKKLLWDSYNTDMANAKREPMFASFYKMMANQTLAKANAAEAEFLEIQRRLNSREALFTGQATYPQFPSALFTGGQGPSQQFFPGMESKRRYYAGRMAGMGAIGTPEENRISSAQAQGALTGVREEGLLGLQKLFADRGKKFNYGEISNLVYGTGLYGDIGSAMRGELQRGGAPLSMEEQMAITKAGNQYLAPNMFLSQGQQETLGLNSQSTESNTKAIEDNTRAMINMAEYLKAFLTTGSFAAGRAWIGGF